MSRNTAKRIKALEEVTMPSSTPNGLMWVEGSPKPGGWDEAPHATPRIRIVGVAATDGRHDESQS